jgi:pyruvate dehydrogenase E2 component (dihydrolipoamide acetyltransferase)
MDAEVLVAALRRLRDSVDPALTISDLLLRALASGVRNLIEPDSVDLGLAVATPGGVVVPVITRVLDRELHSLGEARRKAVARAREGRLNEEDLTRVPWATLSNLGSLGVDHFTGIIPLGQMSLLTVGRIAYRVVSDESREVTVKAAFDATLNADHRKLDGADVAHLLSSIAAAVNDPMILEGKAPFT